MEYVVTYDEKPQEQLMEEINHENKYGKDWHCMKEEFFQDIVDESRTLDVVNDKEKHESICKLETPHLTQESSIIEQRIIYYIESWFQSIVGQAMLSDFGHVQLSLTLVYFGPDFHSLIEALTCSPIQEFIP